MSSSPIQFTGHETIAEILEKMPEAQDILITHGLQCAGCYLGAYETLEQGAAGHGFTDTEIQAILTDINECAKELKIMNVPSKDPELTEKAVKKIHEFQAAQEKKGFGFKIDVLKSGGEFNYFLDFLESPEIGDKTIKSRGIKMFISPESLRLLQDCTIDFVSTDEGEGFKISKE